jgi:hypothetical protein
MKMKDEILFKQQMKVCQRIKGKNKLFFKDQIAMNFLLS